MENNIIEHRLTALETKMSELLENHIPHLEAKLDRAHWMVITTLVSVIIGLVMIFFKR